MVFPKIKIPEAVIKHLPDILTGANVVGVVGTAFLTGKASVKASKKLESITASDDGSPVLKLKWTDKVKLTWKYYILAFLAGTATIASGIASNRISAKRLAEVTAVAALYADRVKSLEEKFEQKYGKDELNKVKDEMKNEQLCKPMQGEKMLCYEPVSKQYFRATQEEIMMAELTANKIMLNDMNAESGITMNKFLSLLPGCKPFRDGNIMGWWCTDVNGEADFNWSFVKGGPWIDIQPFITEHNGHPVLEIRYAMWPMERSEWIDGDTNDMLRTVAGKAE